MRCKLNTFCIFSFQSTYAECFLDFGAGTIFEYTEFGDDMVKLERKNTTLYLPLEDFLKLFNAETEF